MIERKRMFLRVSVPVLTALAVVCLPLLGGCPALTGAQGPAGPQGAQGPQGPAGPAGLSTGAPLPGTVVNITDVSGSSPVSVGSPLKATFTLKTKAGENIDINDLTRFSIYVSGPADNYQIVIPGQSDVTKATANTDGSYTYTFPDSFPSVYAAPLNDSSAFGAANGELTGQAITPGTYTVGIEARRDFTVEGQTVRDAGDATFDFPVGGATLAPRQLVLQDNCDKCHNQLQLHGGNRFKVTGCVLCHTNGAEDSISSDPAKATTGVTIAFANMIHKIHRGAELPRVAATANSSDPYRYEIIGFQGSVNDFSDVEFPYMPGGTGFDAQTRNCAVCHGGAAEGDQIYADKNITKANCTSCHDDLNFTSGTILDGTNNTIMLGELPQSQLDNPAFRKAPGGTSHKFSDGACVLCHSAGLAVAVEDVHRAPLSDPNNIIGLKVVVQSVTGNSGAGFFQAGDKPVITFVMRDRNDNPVDIADVASISLVVAGPAENYQKIIPSSGSSVSLKSALPASGTGPFTYTAAAIPATYPPPLNDSTAFTFDDGWGELSGRALDSGSFTVAVWAYRQFTIDTTTYREASPSGFFPIRVGSAGTAAGYPGYVSDAKCNACHGDLALHGGGRKGVAECVLCHTGGAEDRPNVIAGQTQDPASDTIDFKVMIHKIHYARHLSVVQNGGKYDIVGFASGTPSDTGSVVDFSHGDFPAMPDGAKNCTLCHATDAWKAPVERSDVNIWKVACTSCHDSSATSVHVQLNTLPDGISAGCAVCHGAGADFAIDKFHNAP